jgi:hypothetical protein
MLTFDESTHTYYWNNNPVPSVTKIINEFLQVTINGSQYHINRYSGVVIPSYLMEEGAAKGKDLHYGAELILKGGIDWNALDPDYVPPLRQFEKFLSDFDIRPLYTEYRFYHPKMKFCGTIDLLAVINGVISIVDFKTGIESFTVGLQTSAYREGYCSQEKYLGKIDRYVLYLPKDGSSYKFKRLNDESDLNKFKACMILKELSK